LNESGEVGIIQASKAFDYSGQAVLKKWNEELHKHFLGLSELEVTLCSIIIYFSLLNLCF
jgi:hypothetical protein